VDLGNFSWISLLDYLTRFFGTLKDVLVIWRLFCIWFWLQPTVKVHARDLRITVLLSKQWRRGTHVVVFWGEGARAVLFRQTENFFRQTKNFSGRQHLKSSATPHPPSTSLTISDNIDNFPTGLNNRGGHGAPWSPGHGATVSIKPPWCVCTLLGQTHSHQKYV
jgi:hypothetical protein